MELTRFRVSSDRTEQLLAARPAMLRDFEADRAGFIDARLVRLPDDEWLDIVFWRSAKDLAASRAKGGNLPYIRVFLDLIDETVSSEEGTMHDVRLR
ncbi:hypothetical protein ACI2K4_05715 [Micromonospora sp. NPDC050397]|uniref:hypothetical protein n=1 Tax=Micromonospora sp. NPDC050397 TaxID=3364279 RepID=UPI00384DE9CB